MAQRSEQPRPSRDAGYVDVDRISNPDGITVVISQRKKTGALTFTMFREYEDSLDGEIKRTGFVSESMFDAFISLAQQAKARMEHLRTSGELPFPVRKSGC